jgi:hypothetical protein
MDCHTESSRSVLLRHFDTWKEGVYHVLPLHEIDVSTMNSPAQREAGRSLVGTTLLLRPVWIQKCREWMLRVRRLYLADYTSNKVLQLNDAACVHSFSCVSHIHVLVSFHSFSKSLYLFFRCLFPLFIYFLPLLLLCSCFNFAHSLANIAVLKTVGRGDICIKVLLEHLLGVIGEMN